MEFAAEAVNKYADHLPLERQVRMMKREGLSIDSQTLGIGSMPFRGRWSRKRYEALKQRALSSPVVHADETGWPLLDKKKQKNESRGSVWTLSTPGVVVYRDDANRSRKRTGGSCLEATPARWSRTATWCTPRDGPRTWGIGSAI